MKLFNSVAAIAIAAGAGVIGSTGAHAADCQSLIGKTFDGALIVGTDNVTSPITVTSLANTRQAVSVTAPFCRVRGLITPTANSNINFELWLPPEEQWNGKYQGDGNGGFLGAMMYGAMDRALRAGYAVASTDTGHKSTGGKSSWALNQPQKITDFGWRAVHEMTVASKAIVSAYYGRPAEHSYFVGCSRGGGSAMMEAERFPEDYNGIIAGAPGINQSGQIASYLWTQQAVTATPGSWLSPAKLDLLHKAVLSECKGEGGMLADPAACHFDPAQLQCKGSDTDKCLTAEQVATVRKIYSGPQDASGRSLYPGLAYGSELEWNALMGPKDRPGVGTGIFHSMMGYLGNLLYGNTDWDYRTLKASEVMQQVETRLRPSTNSVNPDLSVFKAAGGKLIQYQGWDDPTVRPGGTIQYYNSVVAKMGGRSEVQSFYRLFMAPGMNHCGGGVGPNAVGGSFNSPAPSHDPQHDIVAALVQWVEQGRAPDSIIATRYRDNDPTKGIAAQRPWCPYPAKAHYTGHGDVSQAASYVCKVSRN